MNRHFNLTPVLRRLTVCGCLLFQLIVSPAAGRAAEEPGVVDRTKVAVQDTAKQAKESVTEAGRAVGGQFEKLRHELDESRLKNRTRDEVVAWVIMGVLVGAVAGMLTSLRTSGLGNVGRLTLGLAGAFLGGIIVHVTQMDFGMGLVIIRYEELLFSLAGAIALLVFVRLIRSSSKKKPGE